MKATWKEGTLTIGDQTVSVCTDGLKVLGIKKPDEKKTYEFEIDVKLVKPPAPKFKKGQMVRVKAGESQYSYTKPGWIGVVVESGEGDCIEVRGPINLSSTRSQTYSLFIDSLELYCDVPSRGI